MKYVNLSSGLQVSQVCLGTWHLPGTGQLDSYGIEKVDGDEFKRIVKKAYDAGINFIDTSNRYHGRMETTDLQHVGYSEKLLGEILKGYERESLVITTKVRGKMAAWPNGEGLSRKHIMWQIKESLKRLQLEYVDLYQIHWQDPYTPKIETLQTLSSLVDHDLVRYIGASNHSAAEVVEFMELAERHDLQRLVSIQEQYSLLQRGLETDRIPVARRYGLSLLSYSPLAEGILSGKYLAGIQKGSRVSYAPELGKQYLNPETLRAVRVLQDMAKEKQITLPQLAISWMLHKQAEFGIVIIPLLGATRQSQLEDNVRALDVSLSKDDIARIEETASKSKVTLVQ